MTGNEVVVIIAAYNAADTIHKAIQSALIQPEVAEVIVIDDASQDDTARIARESGGSDSRLRVIPQTINSGPSAARNVAIRESSSPFIAILDADDMLLPGRFTQLFQTKDWDFIADNILFCRDLLELDNLDQVLSQDTGLQNFTVDLGPAEFIAGNISKRGRQRGELGFLKPVMRRSFLEAHNLTYSEDCRLGEDFLLYSQGLLRGGRMRLIGKCGYVALIRPNSLSGGHSVKDLRDLYTSVRAQTRNADYSQDLLAIMKQHLSSIERRLRHREVLQIKSEKGLFSGLSLALRHPSTLIGILRDRFSGKPPPAPTPRLLFQVDDVVG